MNKLGLKDLPIEKKDDESLGIGDYADVLTEFIRNCDTPITIALQGDWGSGKTSLMNLINSDLKSTETASSPFITIWFNTWQYSQFELAGSLPLSMMQNLTSKLEEWTDRGNQNRERFEKLKTQFKRVGKATVLAGASFIGLHDTTKAGMDAYQDQTLSTSDLADTLSEIKDGLKKVVEEATNGSKRSEPKKVVVFIDDLDRIEPIRAVELLEALKIFLDIDRCVYVLACDYGVVTTGLREKFSWTKDSPTGKDFFDKIIQVPFKMPVKKYDPELYLNKLLDNTNLQFEQEDISRCQELIEYSVGFNPRTIKRVLNMLQLLVLLDDKKQEVNDIQNAPPERLAERRASNRVMFGILCMIEAYEPIYEYIIKDIPLRIKQLQSGLESVAEEDRDQLEESVGAHRMPLAIDFCKSFVRCIQLDRDDTISREEIEHLTILFSHTALVGHGSQAEDFDELAFSTKTKSKLNQQYRDFVTCKKPAYGKFRKTHNSVYLPLHWFGDLLLCVKSEDTIFQFGLESESNADKIEELGVAMCSRLNWTFGGRFENVDYTHYFWFVEVSRDSQSGEEQFMEKVYEFLDLVTDPVSKLYNLIKESMPEQRVG